MASETATQRKRRLEDQKKRYQHAKASETDSKKKNNKKRSEETDEARQKRLQGQQERNKRKRAEETDVARQKRLQGQQERNKRKRAEETDEARQKRLQEQLERDKRKRAEETDEARQKRLQGQQERDNRKCAEETDEARQKRLQGQQERDNRKRATETDEARQKRLQGQQERDKRKRAEETDEARQKRLQGQQEREKRKRAEETDEARQKRLQEQQERDNRKRATEIDEARQKRLQGQQERDKRKRAEETDEARQKRLQGQQDRDKRKHAEETDEARQKRLQGQQERDKRKHAEETDESRKKRLLDQQKRDENRRLIAAGDAEQFDRSIDVFADQHCNVCLKRSYPNQLSTVVLVPGRIPPYLPPELAQKDSLLLCHRCKTHLKSSKKTLPPKSYWNNLDPGNIPNEIKCLSQVEQRLLSRVIPFLKVVKFTGLFGQYGFKGQAILFAQDIFEVTERLPRMLPRSSDSAGIIVVVEELENLNRTREFSVSRERLNAALNWLIRNNPLYADVTNVAESCAAEEPHIVRIQPRNAEPANPEVAIPPSSAFTAINASSRLIRASWNQSDRTIFNPQFTGSQCAVMALSMLVKIQLLPPSRWTTNTCNEVLLGGNNLYERVRSLLDDTGVAVPASGHLLVNNFGVIKNSFEVFGTAVSLEYDDDPAIYGSLEDRRNVDGFGFTLLQGLNRLFQNHSGGILIASDKAVAVAQSLGKFYFCDSHSCGPKGAPAENGRACVVECDTLKELHRICKRSTGSQNVSYTLDFVEVSLPDAVLPESPQSGTAQVTAPLVPVSEETALPILPEERPIAVATIPVATSVMRPIDYEQPREESVLQDLPEEDVDLNRIKRKTRDNIVNDTHELKAEEFAWFYLFPYGINGFKHARPVAITPLDYFQFRILGSDLRFQRNDYLFYALSMYEYYRIKSNIAVCGKKIRLNESMVDNVHLYVKNLRGSAAYWRTALNELVGQIRCLGPPHFFVTLSCNDLHWVDMITALLKADGDDSDPAGVEIHRVQSLIEQYPTVISRHFMVRVNALMKQLRQNPRLFGGIVADYWWRVEFQNRGSPHLHMVLWVEGTPDFSTDAGVERIDEVISCERPEDPELRRLVDALQIHRHTQTCHKNSSSSCRFSFPRVVCEKTHVIHHTSDDFVRNGGRICVLKRRSGEEFINNYNPYLLKLWKANMDIQPCGSNEAIAFYIAKYISKNETTELDSGLREAINRIRKDEDDVSRRLFRICMSVLNERQVSACECVYRLCHLRMRDSSRKCVFLNTRKPEQRYKVLTFGNDDVAKGFCSNLFDRYQKRPLQHPDYDFPNMSLLEFAMLFEPYYNKVHSSEDDGDDDIDGQPLAERSRLLILTDNSKMKVRSVPAVVRVPFFQEACDPENFYYSLLAQYAPFRQESELMEGHYSAKAAFLVRENDLKASSVHMANYRNRDKQLENAFNQAHAFEELQENRIPPDDEEIEDIPEEAVMQDAEFDSVKGAMNVGQRELFSFITAKIQSQIHGSSHRVRMFITGGAGTGKTFTLKVLNEQIRRCYGGEKKAVKVCALTGVAARLVGGSTLHSALKLPVQKDGKLLNMPLLSGEYLKRMRCFWKDVEFFIIDEISMIPYEMLCMIDQRLKQLKDSLDLFGGVNVLLFGDLMQLPPVRGNLIFEQPERMQPATHLWREFSFCELTQNMRQRGDSTFVDLLNDLRMGAIKREQVDVLLTKLEGNDTGEFQIGRALRIHPTIKLVDEHNNKVLQQYVAANVAMWTVTAQDRIVDCTRNTENVDMNKVIPQDVNKTGGLPKQLTLFVGAKVMLRSNIDTGKGLVNGAIGNIVEIIWPLFRRAQMYEQDIPAVRVDFGEVGIHRIEPKSVQFDAKYSYGTAERRMLPLILCWSSTVHKMQGSTVDHAVINLGPKIFAPGQAYVALSRVRSLDGVRLEELDCTKVTGPNVCNRKTLGEMERLRHLPHYADQ